MAEDNLIQVEIVCGTPAQQRLVAVSVRAGSTCTEVIAESGICDSFPDENLESAALAIWGRVVDGNERPKNGDRIEILRPLTIDPRDARRQLATAGEFMGGSGREVDE